LVASALLSLLQFFFEFLLSHFFNEVFVEISDNGLIPVEILPVVLCSATVVRPFALISEVGITVII
jgi:hypothetical protein